MVSGWRSSVSVSVSASNWFTDCIRAADAASDAAYNASLQLQLAQQQWDMAANEALVAAAAAAASTCRSLSLTAVASVQAWQSAGAELQYNADDCSPSELLYLQELIGGGSGDDGDAAAASASTSNFSSTYANLTATLLDDAVGSVDARVAYDSQYVQSKAELLGVSVDLLVTISDPFPSVQLSGALAALDAPVDALIACVHGDVSAGAGSGGGVCSASLASLYEPVVDGLQLSLSQAQSTLESALSQASAYSAEVTAALQSCAVFFTYLQSFSAALASIGISVPIPSLPPLVPFSFDGDAAAAEAGVVVDDVSVAFARLFQPAEAAFRSSFALITATAVQSAEDFVAQLQNVSLHLPELLSDYQPPRVDLQVRAIAHTARSAAATFAQQLALALHIDSAQAVNQSSVQMSARAASEWADAAASGDGDDSDSGNLDGASSNSSAASMDASASALLSKWSSASSLSSSLPSSVDFSFAAFTGSVDVNGLVDSLAGFFFLFVVLDYAWRAYRSLHTLLAVLHKPNDQLPPVDTRPRMERDGGSPASSSGGAHSLLLTLALQPVVLYVAVAVVVSLSVYPLVLLYVQLLWAPYMSGCVQSRNGTLLTLNAAALLYNAASAEGRLYSLALLSAFDARAAVDCASAGARGLDSSISSELSAARAEASIAASLAQLGGLQRCLSSRSFNASALPPSVASAFSLPSPFASLLLPSTVVSSCSADASSSLSFSSQVRLAALNCSALPSWSAAVCSTSTSSAMASISTSAWQSGCDTSYAGHTWLLQCACVCLVFVCLNLSRSLIVQGWVRLLWFHLCPAGLTALVHVGESGVMEQAAVERMQWSVQDRLVAYRKEALRYFTAGLLAHLPYIALLATLAYTVHGIPQPRTQTQQ